jgi:hypothetical protein
LSIAEFDNHLGGDLGKQLQRRGTHSSDDRAEWIKSLATSAMNP